MHNFYWFSVFVAMNASILLLLAIRVTVLRFKHRIVLGDGDNKDLVRAIRVHSNGTEQVPIFGLLLLALTGMQLSSLWLCVLVVIFTVARIIHLVGMLWRLHAARKIGAAITYLAQAVAIVLLCTKIILSAQ